MTDVVTADMQRERQFFRDQCDQETYDRRTRQAKSFISDQMKCSENDEIIPAAIELAQAAQDCGSVLGPGWIITAALDMLDEVDAT